MRRNSKIMKILLLILYVVAATASPRIVGGSDTDISKVPYQLVLERFVSGTWRFDCGGSIVGQNTVVTAAHCVMRSKPEEIRFRSGTNSRLEGEIHNVTGIMQHPLFNFSTNYVLNDIAICQVVEPFNYSDTVQPITLIDAEPKAGTPTLVSGYGIVKENGEFPENLQSVELVIVDREVCTKAYHEIGQIVEETGICSGVADGSKDTCFGDWGGPLVVDGKLAGIVSWGIGCAHAGYPAVFTNVALYKDWVLDQIQNFGF